MGWTALLIATLGALCLALPQPGMFFAMGLGLFGVATGAMGYRRRTDSGGARLAGAAAVVVSLGALLLSLTQYGLTLAALRRLEALF